MHYEFMIVLFRKHRLVRPIVKFVYDSRTALYIKCFKFRRQVLISHNEFGILKVTNQS